MATVRFIHKNIAFGAWRVDESLLKANGGPGFKAGQFAGLTDEEEIGLANDTTIPAFGVFQDNDWEVTGAYVKPGAHGSIPAGTQASMKPTVLFGSGTILYIKPEEGEAFTDVFGEAAANFTLNKKVYVDANGKATTDSDSDKRQLVAYVVQAPTVANGNEVGLKLVI